MFKNAQLFTLYSITPIHPGSGSGLSYVDLPVQRERHTSFPMIAGSSLKGVIREVATRAWKDDSKVETFFGSSDGGDKASNVAFTDAKILLYPVRSVRGIFALITCPYILKRIANEIDSLYNKNFNFNDINVADNEALYVAESVVLMNDNDKNKIGLEEFIFNAKPLNKADLNSLFELITLHEELKRRIVIVSDTVFTDLVNYAVDIRTRIKIDQTKGVAAEGALFTIEMVPSESIFYSFIIVKDGIEDKEMFELLNDRIIQIGGDETTGNGFMKIKFSK